MVRVIQLVKVENKLYIQLCPVPILQSIRGHLEAFLPSNKIKQEHSETILKAKERKKNQSHLDSEAPVVLTSCSKDVQGFVCCTFQPAETAVCEGKSRAVPQLSDTVSDTTWKSQGPTAWPWGNTSKHP